MRSPETADASFPALKTNPPYPPLTGGYERASKRGSVGADLCVRPLELIIGVGAVRERPLPEKRALHEAPLRHPFGEITTPVILATDPVGTGRDLSLQNQQPSFIGTFSTTPEEGG